MFQSTGRFETAHGVKYLTQLCKHFAHKIEVSHGDGHGECHFPFGHAVMKADVTGLAIEVDAPDADQLARTKAVIDDHLVRFAFREPERSIAWSA
ncbi:DUF2218 domain-containing protein [Aminobacter sp. NyZ550]|jgi:hypothetical protein|uniref:2,4-dihydroxyhept-2-ene-1,7-dioic acid aldolase n=2 Tax=Aminobacter TaxID=31988 RepID=A0AAC8YIV6_AMIAI|nr:MULTISPECIES: DUF2218 domain-containing protein [Aminobacter]AMS39117.1 hypothetical protein AA2016_0175 [Aminobacter aminovorans]MBA8905205.1 hypothetical protein [Aminobacter ciceronei]MBA9018933.1 hypothetical protein [Aminobacter ciceronei]MBB3706948.1 hypothetical protein [Aminobacter aminovorans]MRX32737.1 DUF2218 domain-containing protein [Aminobacter sp. MDW-2]